jgi:AcrR family transcriptional regulator
VIDKPPRSRYRGRMDDPLQPDAEQILDAALVLGERLGWDALHLHDLAQALGVGLPAIHRHYAGKDALAEAWFDRADRALLAAGEAPGWRDLPVRDRLERALWAWLQAQARHRRLSAAMLRYKLQLDHLHLQAQGVLRVSRTVQWWREVARLPSTGLRREAEEVALTGLFLAAYARWLRDDTPEAAHTRDWLARQLARAESLALRWPG